MTCGLTRQSLMNISSSWKNQQAITTKKPKPATLVPTKLNAREISAMTVKCTFCNDAKQEPGIPGPCVWCEEVEPVTLGTVTRYAESCGEGGGVVEHASGKFVEFKDYDAALAREAAFREELNRCDSMAVMIEQKEWAEHAGSGPVSSRVESAFTQLHNELSEAQQRLTVAEQRAGELEAALKFYADGDHLLLADADAWDTCSGEPINFLHDEAGTASVEDGSIAKAALKPAAEVIINEGR